MVHDALYWGATYPDLGSVDIFWLLAGWIWIDPLRDTKHIELYFNGRLSCKLHGGGIGITLKLFFSILPVSTQRAVPALPQST